MSNESTSLVGASSLSTVSGSGERSRLHVSNSRFGGWAQLRATQSGSLPPRSLARRWALVFCLSSAGVALGCADDVNPPAPCGAPTPAFRFEATTLQEPLPDDLELRVEFGGAQSEAYKLGADNVGEVACCVTVAQVADAPRHVPCGVKIQSDAAVGPDAVVAPNAVVCDLWTNGAVDLTVLMGDQVIIEQTLHAKLLDEKSDCGQFETLTAHWVLGESDAGVVVDGY
jgi:hypothetical protein